MVVLSAKSKLAGVMGWPVHHSRSPRLHGYWLEKHGIDGVYLPLAVAPERLEAALRGLPALGFAGCNLTLPHKERALAIVDETDDLARRIGAVNAVFVNPDGSLKGSNTDAYGFLENLPAIDWRGKAAAVLGAGGAARAVLVALIDAGIGEIRLTNRTRVRADAMAGQIGGPIRVIDWAARATALADTALLVNTTSLGMTGQPPLALTLDDLPSSALVNDIVYAPLETDLLRQARARGNPAVDGLGMLLHQARPAFAAWFGQPVEVDRGLRDFVLSASV